MAWFTKGLYYDTKYKKRGPSGSGTVQIVPGTVPSTPWGPVDPDTHLPLVPDTPVPPGNYGPTVPTVPTNPVAPPIYNPPPPSAPPIFLNPPSNVSMDDLRRKDIDVARSMKDLETARMNLVNNSTLDRNVNWSNIPGYDLINSLYPRGGYGGRFSINP